MKRLLRTLAIAFAVTSGLFCQPLRAATDAEVETQASALEVAGAFSNDGFKIRDGHWWSPVAPHVPKIIQVNLYAGNQYWFIAAGSQEAKRLLVNVYDENRNLVLTEPYENNAQSAAGFSPTTSGPYYVRVEEVEGAPATFCLLYTYK